jgi:hypothetical protein
MNATDSFRLAYALLNFATVPEYAPVRPIDTVQAGDIRTQKFGRRLGKELKSRVSLLCFVSPLKPAFPINGGSLDAQALDHACGCNPYCWLARPDRRRPNPGAWRGDPALSGAQRDVDPTRRLRTAPVCRLPLGHAPVARPMRPLLSKQQLRI